MTSDEHALPDKLSRELWLLIVTLIIIQITVTFTSLTLAVSAPSVASAYGISTEFIGYQISLIYVAAAMTATTADYQLNRWGAIRISQISLLFSAVGAVFMVLPSLWFIILGSLLIGVGYGMTNPAASQVLMGSTPPTIGTSFFLSNKPVYPQAVSAPVSSFRPSTSMRTGRPRRC